MTEIGQEGLFTRLSYVPYAALAGPNATIIDIWSFFDYDY